MGHDIAELFRLAVHGLFRLVHDALAIQQGHLELIHDAHRRPALEHIVGTHADALERAEEVEQHVRRIVHAGEQNGLARDGYALIHQVGTCGRRLWRNFISMVELHVCPYLSARGEAFCECARDACGVDARGARAEAHHVHLRQIGECAHETQHLIVGQHERVTARKKYVAHFGTFLHVVDASGKFLVRAHYLSMAQQSLTRTVAAVHETGVGRHHQHAVWETLLQAEATARLVLLAEWIGADVVLLLKLARVRLQLAPERLAPSRKRPRIRAGDEREALCRARHVRRTAH